MVLIQPGAMQAAESLAAQGVCGRKVGLRMAFAADIKYNRKKEGGFYYE